MAFHDLDGLPPLLIHIPGNWEARDSVTLPHILTYGVFLSLAYSTGYNQSFICIAWGYVQSM